MANNKPRTGAAANLAAAAAANAATAGDQAAGTAQQPAAEQTGDAGGDPAAGAAVAAAVGGTRADAAALADEAGDELSDEDKADLAAAAELDRQRAAGAKAQPNAPGLKRPVVPEQRGRMNATSISLLLEACDVFGVSPYADQKPQELLAWVFYPGADDAAQVTPDAVVIVTAGGQKLKHYDDPDYPMDPDTKEDLERIFGAASVDPVSKQPVIRPLPDNLTLPAVIVTGRSHSTDHVYQGGYLRGGGRKAAADKAARRAEREKRFGLK